MEVSKIRGYKRNGSMFPLNDGEQRVWFLFSEFLTHFLNVNARGNKRWIKKKNTSDKEMFIDNILFDLMLFISQMSIFLSIETQTKKKKLFMQIHRRCTSFFIPTILLTHTFHFCLSVFERNKQSTLLTHNDTPFFSPAISVPTTPYNIFSKFSKKKKQQQQIWREFP